MTKTKNTITVTVTRVDYEMGCVEYTVSDNGAEFEDFSYSTDDEDDGTSAKNEADTDADDRADYYRKAGAVIVIERH